ncbi:hypothetical protein [Aeromonas veronii]|uniref:hypothetical protein n=1 Tax=Aeromonas veronii TaxID=654 RepID=UPI003D1B48BF
MILLRFIFVFLFIGMSHCATGASVSSHGVHDDKFWSEFDKNLEEYERLQAQKELGDTQGRQGMQVNTNEKQSKDNIGTFILVVVVLVIGWLAANKSMVPLMSNEKKIYSALISLFILMSIVPPWKFVVNTNMTRKEIPAGYSLISSPPSLVGHSNNTGVTIDIERLVIQFGVLGGIAAIVFINRNVKQHQNS